MSVQLSINFPAPASSQLQFTHRVRNLAEDIERAFSAAGIGHVENMDSADLQVLCTIDAGRLVGEATKIARAQMSRHGLDDGATIERLR